MKALPLFLILIWTPVFGQSPQNSPALTDQEKRQVLGQLLELKSCRQEVIAYEQFISRESVQDAKEKANSDRALELEKQATALAQQERDLARDKAAMYENLYRSVTKKPGIGCRIWRAVSLGIGRCQ